MQASPYLFFNGNCEEAFKAYAHILRGKIEAMMPHKGTPAAGGVSAEWQDKILHAHLSAGDVVLLGSDAPPGHQDKGQGGFSISLTVDSAAEADRVFHALVEGGTVRMPIAETFFAMRFGMLTDRFGIPWMVMYAKPK